MGGKRAQKDAQGANIPPRRLGWFVVTVRCGEGQLKPISYGFPAASAGLQDGSAVGHSVMHMHTDNPRERDGRLPHSILRQTQDTNTGQGGPQPECTQMLRPHTGPTCCWTPAVDRLIYSTLLNLPKLLFFCNSKPMIH